MSVNDNESAKTNFINEVIGQANCSQVFGEIFDDTNADYNLRFDALTPLEYIIVVYIVGECYLGYSL